MEKDKTNGAEVSQEQIDGWKAKYGKVYRIEVGGRSAIVRKPDRRILKAQAAEKNPITQGEILLDNCWLAGDNEIRTDDGLFLAVAAKVNELISVAEVELKEL